MCNGVFGACGGRVHGLTPYVRKCPRDWKLTLTGCSVPDTVLYALYLLTYLILNIIKVAQRRVWTKEEAVLAQAGKYLAHAYTIPQFGPFLGHDYLPRIYTTHPKSIKFSKSVQTTEVRSLPLPPKKCYNLRKMT